MLALLQRDGIGIISRRACTFNGMIPNENRISGIDAGIHLQSLRRGGRDSFYAQVHSRNEDCEFCPTSVRGREDAGGERGASAAS